MKLNLTTTALELIMFRFEKEMRSTRPGAKREANTKFYKLWMGNNLRNRTTNWPYIYGNGREIVQGEERDDYYTYHQVGDVWKAFHLDVLYIYWAENNMSYLWEGGYWQTIIIKAFIVNFNCIKHDTVIISTFPVIQPHQQLSICCIVLAQVFHLTNLPRRNLMKWQSVSRYNC